MLHEIVHLAKKRTGPILYSSRDLHGRQYENRHVPVCVRMCLLRELIQGKARGQYGQRSLCGESAYELRLRFMTHNSLDVVVSLSANDDRSPRALDDKPPSELELDSICLQQQPANTDNNT